MCNKRVIYGPHTVCVHFEEQKRREPNTRIENRENLSEAMGAVIEQTLRYTKELARSMKQ